MAVKIERQMMRPARGGCCRCRGRPDGREYSCAHDGADAESGQAAPVRGTLERWADVLAFAISRSSGFHAKVVGHRCRSGPNGSPYISRKPRADAYHAARSSARAQEWSRLGARCACDSRVGRVGGTTAPACPGRASPSRSSPVVAHLRAIRERGLLCGSPLATSRARAGRGGSRARRPGGCLAAGGEDLRHGGRLPHAGPARRPHTVVC